MLPSDLFLWIADSEFWFPRDYSWDDVREVRDHPINWFFGKLFPAICIAFVMREAFVRLVFKRWGNRLNISGDKSKKAPLCEELENVYVKEGVQVMHASERLSRISVGTRLSPALVYKWFKIRRLQDEVSDLDKFVEDCWLALLTTLLSTLGFLIINDQSFNLDSYWGNYPLERVGLCQELYYLAGMAFFVVDSVVLVTKRHETFDLPLRIYHHTLSFLLMGVSWTSNEVRVGCLILLTFETSSPLGYTAKVAERLNLSITSRVLFGAFLIYWFAIRTVWLYFMALPSFFITRHRRVGFVPAYILSDLLFAQLAVVNLIWTRMICLNIRKAFRKGEFFKHDLDENSFIEVTNALKRTKKID